MGPSQSAALIALLVATTGCTTSAEDVDFTCSRKSCPETGIVSESGVDAPIPETDEGVKTDSTAPADTAVPADLDASGGDVIFPIEDTAPPCEAGGTFCGDEEGCKNLPTDLTNCGMCGKTCAPVAAATVSCAAGKCEFKCNAGRDDCDMSEANGCETLLNTDENNCGTCGKKCLATELCTAGTCTPKVVVIESFEPSWPKSPWVVGNGSATGSASATCAHDGTLGYAAPALNPIHYYRTDVTVGAPGDKLTAWYRTSGSGRFYFGFGATATGAWSLVAAPNTNQLYFERNAPYGTYTSLTTKSRTWSTGVWHKLEISFAAGGVVTGRVYAADGTTLLDTISTTIAGFTPGGVALRAFAAGTCIDTYER